MNRLSLGLIVGMALLQLAVGKRADAGLYATMNFNQEVFASGPSYGVNQVVSGMSLPIQQTATLDDLEGGKIMTTYNVADNGTVATLDITSSGALSALGNTVDDGNSVAGSETNFSFSQPVSYKAILTETGAGYLYLSLNVTNVQATALSDSSTTFTGTTQGFMALYETWDLSNDDSGSQVINESGTNSVEFTFTAIPEPSTAALIMIPAAAFLIRRSRRSTSPHEARVQL